MKKPLFLLPVYLLLMSCSGQPWNFPYLSTEFGSNTLFSSFSERPKHMDPARSYSSNEYAIIGQIYEPPLQYHYLKRPYEIIPLTSVAVPVPEYYDHKGDRLPNDAESERISRSVYDIKIQPGIMYQPHPAFAKNGRKEGLVPRLSVLGLSAPELSKEDYLYHDLSPAQLGAIYELADFAQTGQRELTAADYIYQIKRLASAETHSPIFGVMSEYIMGLSELRKNIAHEQVLSEKVLNDKNHDWLDLRDFDLAGVELVDRYTYRISIKGKYPQFIYWLAMPFFAALPYEADRFYAQQGLREKNISLDWYPVGTGAYMLTVNNPNKRMVLVKNPNYRHQTYPNSGEAGDAALGLLDDAGKTLPFIEKIIFSLEKEVIPYWNKFLQGYYDASGVGSDSFDQAIQIGSGGDIGLTEDMQKKGIQLKTAVAASTYYFGFNMLDSVVGGLSEKSQQLRRAIAIAVDYEEYISIFLNGRGIAAQSPLPVGIFGYRAGRAGLNTQVYDWVNGKAKRKPLAAAKQLLTAAGFPNGIDENTGKPLLLYLDTTGTGPDSKAQLAWWRKQFKKLNIQLVIRSSDYNRFQEKMAKGTAQLFQWGWNADYPDPENFFFLLHGANSKVAANGENATNYQNDEFDHLFEVMRNMDNSPRRQVVIDKMVKLLQMDSPWLFGLHPKQFSLHHDWYSNVKPHLMSHNTLQYRRINGQQRVVNQQLWNQPIIWPVIALLLLLVVSAIPGVLSYRKKEHGVPLRSGSNRAASRVVDR
ncbi:MAG: ABC transporter substrate-binding protein [Gammaproteobacteria bacterium]|nr:ABC transporter substrate-binding protein [Gammaproteobacteria bacterium]